MRNMSFALTEDTYLNGSKTVTRRKGWLNLRCCDEVMAVRKSMGLKAGEQIKRLGPFVVKDIRRERLCAIEDEPDGCAREGFPQWSPEQFIAFYCEHNKGVTPNTEITRVEFMRLPWRPQ